MGTVKYSGPIASFHCPTEAEIRSLKVHFSPKQLGEGTPSPENVREIEGWDGVEVSQHGCNLYSRDNVIPHTADDEWNCIMAGAKQKIAVSSWPRWTFIAPAIPNATYYWKTQCYDVGFLDKDKNVLTYKNGWSNTSIKAPANAGYVYHTWIKNESISQEQLDAAFKTYDLYCDVLPVAFEPQNSKKTNYEFGVLGKNKFNAYDWQYEQSCIEILDSNSLEVKQIPYIENNNSYDINSTKGIARILSFKAKTVSLSDSRAAVSLFALGNEGQTRLSSVYINLTEQGYETEYTLSIPAECDMIQFCNWGYTGTLALSNIQLELGSTATTYEPYDPNKTVYGGWVDLISGEVVREWVLNTHTIATTDGTPGGTGTGGDTNYRFVAWNLASAHLPDSDRTKQAVCDIAPYSTQTGSSRFWLGGGTVYMVLPNDNKEYSATVAYAERDLNVTTYHLAPHSTELKTFLSQNNVWSNADYVEVEYDLHETQSILARKQFIVANQPHIVKPAAAPLQNFVTDMAAPLKSCKVYFSPVQDTSNGAPSPDNICPISGWTGVEVYRTGKNMLDTATSDEILENWTLINPTYQKNIEKLPTNLDFILQANITKDLEENISNCRLYMFGALTSGKFINTATPLGVHTVTNKPDANGMLRISHNYIGLRPDRYGATFNNMQLELGSTATTYEPYNGTTIPITFPSEAGTVYGGYVDLITGEVWAEYYSIPSSAWHFMRKNNGFKAYSSGNHPTTVLNGSWYCNKVSEYGSFNSSNMNKNIIQKCGMAQGGVGTTYIALDENEDISTVQVIYQVNTPQFVATLTPTQLKTLRGTNNIWASNGGDNIEIAYWKH